MNANTIIDSIISAYGEGDSIDLKIIINALEDGEALKNLGFNDDDQESIECAHALVKEAIKAGKTTAAQLKA